MSRERRHIRSLRRIARITVLPYTFHIPLPFPHAYQRDLELFMRYMGAYPEIWAEIQSIPRIPTLP